VNAPTRDALAWIMLVAVSVAAGELLRRLNVPGGGLIGPMLVAIAASAGGLVELRVPYGAFAAAQIVLGCLIGEAFTPPVVVQIARDWPVIALVVGSTIAAGTGAAWFLARYGSIAPETAAWGSTPGGAAAMTALSAAFGADPRIVAFMQYLRVTIVVVSAGAVARFLLPAGTHVVPPGTSGLHPLPWATTAAAGLAGWWLASRTAIPAASLLGPMAAAALLAATGKVPIDVPVWALDAAYVTIGLAVGLLYTRATVRYALRVLPQLLAGTFVLVALCAVSAALLVATLHVDALTAYLATTPGGLDSVTAIALGSGANVPLVLAVQALRLVVVVVTGPPVAKIIARRAEKSAP